MKKVKKGDMVFWLSRGQSGGWRIQHREVIGQDCCGYYKINTVEKDKGYWAEVIVSDNSLFTSHNDAMIEMYNRIIEDSKERIQEQQSIIKDCEERKESLLIQKLARI